MHSKNVILNMILYSYFKYFISIFTTLCHFNCELNYIKAYKLCKAKNYVLLNCCFSITWCLVLEKKLLAVNEKTHRLEKDAINFMKRLCTILFFTKISILPFKTNKKSSNLLNVSMDLEFFKNFLLAVKNVMV